jgi:tetratricopeptide (TPR) repeat protein
MRACLTIFARESLTWVKTPGLRVAATPMTHPYTPPKRGFALITLLRRGWETLALLLFLVLFQAEMTGQELKDTPSPDPSVFFKLPLDEEFSSKIKEALKGHEYGRAEMLLVEKIEQNSKSPRLLTLLGHIFFLDGKYLNCAVAMKKAEALGLLDESERFTLAMAYVRLNHNDWAKPELIKLTESNPGKALYPYWVGRLEYAAQQFHSAVARFRRALELDPGFGKAYDNLGLSYEALGEYAEAIHAYQEANRFNRQSSLHSPWPPLNLGTLLLKLNRFSEAEPCLRESLSYDGKFSKAHYQLGVLLEKQQKYAEAIGELKQASASDPSYPEPHYALSRIYRKQGETKNAEIARNTFQRLKKVKGPEASVASGNGSIVLKEAEK